MQDGRSFDDDAASDADAEAGKGAGNRSSHKPPKTQRGHVDVAAPSHGKNKKRKLKGMEGEEARKAKADLDMILMDDGALLASRDGLRGNLLRQSLHLHALYRLHFVILVPVILGCNKCVSGNLMLQRYP